VALLAGGATSLPAHPPDAGTVETIALFDATVLETPESIAILPDGTKYISLALTGEIRKIAPDGTQSTHAWLPIGMPLTPCFGFLAGITGLEQDHDGNLYVSVASCILDHRGVWKVAPDGTMTLLANLPKSALPNGIALHREQLYVADSFGLIWRVPVTGGTAEVWANDSLLKPAQNAVFPGPNGLQVFLGQLYVSNSDQGTILAIPIKLNGTAGPIRVHATLPDDPDDPNNPHGLGCDDFAFDILGNLYCTTDPFNKLLRIFPDGSFETLLTIADGLDGPTAAAFGRRGKDRFNLYITNAAFPFFSTTFRPSLMRLHLELPGWPKP
jgi:sugar lactone lactonase YvrE